MPVTFADVAPILRTNCGECHQPGGAAPFSLLDYRSSRAHASQIVDVIQRGVMPPWKTSTSTSASAGSGPFVGQPRPTAVEIDALQRWVEAGAPEGRTIEADRRSAGGGWRLGKPDLVVTLPTAYRLAPGGQDVFRIFVIRVPGTVARFVRGLEFRPGNPRVVHHANIRLDRSSASRALDDLDREPGYDGLLTRSAVFPAGHFLGWTPGQVAPLLPKGLAWRLEPGTDVVLQLHMQPSGKPEDVQPSVGFFFGADPPERSPAMIRLGRQNIDIPAGQQRYEVTDSYVLPVEVQIHAVQPHAHYRARRVSGIAMLPDGSRRSLIAIDDWDFRWQHLYRFVTPFWVPSGTTIVMRYEYDNSSENPRNPQQPPQRAVWGQRSAEEMGDLWLQVMTRDNADLLTLNRDFRPKAVAEDLVGYEGLIARDPGNAALHDDAAVLYQELGRQREAAAHFAVSAKLKPESAEAHFNLGTALMLSGDPDQAIAAFGRALALEPRHADAHNNLANALASRVRVAEAIEHYRAAIAADAAHVEARNNLGRLLLERGERSEAVAHFREVLRLRPDYVNAHINLGTADASTGDVAGAIEHYRLALQIDRQHPVASNNLGSMLLYRGQLEEAVTHLRNALRLDPRYAEAHFNLGRALRASGNVAEAAEHLREALALRPDWAAPRAELELIERR